MTENKNKSIVKILYYIAPQDRRKIKGVQINEFIFSHFTDEFGEDNVAVNENTSSNIAIFVRNNAQLDVEESNLRMAGTLDLCSRSWYMIEAVYDDQGAFEEAKKKRTPASKKKKEVSGSKKKPDVTENEDLTEDEEEESEIDRIMKKVENLVGAEEFKQLCRNIVRTSQTPEAKYLKDYFERCAICFSIGGGDGFSTYISYLSRLLNATGIKRIDSPYHKAEIKKAEDLDHMAEKLRDSKFKYNIVTMDITFKMDICDSERFRAFLRDIYDDHTDRLPVFKMPYTQGFAKERMIKALSSTFPLIVVDIPPFSTMEYAKFAEAVFNELGYTVEKAAKEELEGLIVQKRNKAHFYGFRSIKQLAGDILYRKNLMEVKEKTDMSLIIKEKDLLPMLDHFDNDTRGIEELDDMIGMQDIKNRIEEIVVQLELAKSLPDSEKPSMHMMFTGAPGTGKTTVARILGKILKQKGLLSKGYFFERTGRDLCGRYIGETAPITNSICRDAYGSILFIDEAYTLAKVADDDKDYGKEALETLLTHMENHRQDFVVIFAGYSEEMKKLTNMNPGLASRMPHEIKFKNYAREELAQIYMKLASRRFAHSEDFEATVYEYFKGLSDEILASENFANARFVRNLYERTVSKAALRFQAQTGERIGADSDITLTAEDFVNASNSDEFNSLQKKEEHVIGFA